MGSFAALAVLGAALGGYWLWRRSSRGRAPRSEERLLRVCRGDAAQADRLIRGELDRSAGLSRAEAASRAVKRYLRDNR